MHFKFHYEVLLMTKNTDFHICDGECTNIRTLKNIEDKIKIP